MDIKVKLGATSLAEAAAKVYGQENEIIWIYYNLWTKLGEKGLNRSVEYKNKTLTFRTWTVALGDSTYANNIAESGPGSGEKLSDYVKNNAWFTTSAQPRANRMKNKADEVITSPGKNPYKDWNSQGNYGDINLSSGKWLQKQESI